MGQVILPGGGASGPQVCTDPPVRGADGYWYLPVAVRGKNITYALISGSQNYGTWYGGYFQKTPALSYWLSNFAANVGSKDVNTQTGKISDCGTSSYSLETSIIVYE